MAVRVFHAPFTAIPHSRSGLCVDSLGIMMKSLLGPTAHASVRALTRVIGTLFCIIALQFGANSPAAVADSGGSSTDDYDTAEAQSFVSDYITTHGLAGAAYVVVKDGEAVTTGAAGDVSASTPMSVGSLSKSFTAFAVLQLVDRGNVDLDAPITDYLPSFTIKGTDPSFITVRMLLTHTSGLPNPLVLPATGNLVDDVAETAEEKVASAPGDSYLYSNLNYRTLALLVQTISGEDFDSYLDAHIFAPLGMDDTTSVITATDRPGLDSGSVSAYGTAVHLPELKAAVAGAGGVISTAEDMGAWLAMQQRDGVSADGSWLLSADLVELSHTEQSHTDDYAMGWQLTSTADPARIGHDGELTKYSARQDLVPSNGYATAVLLSTFTPTVSHPFEISTGLIDISEGNTPEVGAPKSTIIDFVLAALTLIVIALGGRGLTRVQRWAKKRRAHRWWRRILRLAPQAVMPALAGFVFFGLTMGPGNPATPLDAFALWPAAMILVLVGALTGIGLIVARVMAFRSAKRSG